MQKYAGSRHPVSAVVCGLGLNGLGVLRALGSAGVSTIGLDTDLSQPTARSRFGTKLRVRALAGDDFIADLMDLRCRFETNPVLLLTQEESVVTVSAARQTIGNAYRFSMPAHRTMQDLLDKSRFHDLAAGSGFAVPRAITIDSKSEARLLSQLHYPCAFKPTTKPLEYSARFAKAYKVASADKAWRLWTEIRGLVGEAIVQEWIEGEDSDVYFCLQHRPSDLEPPVSFVGRKLAQWPTQVGGTASCIPAPVVADKLTATTNAFFKSVDFVGLGSMEFKHNRRDGRFYLIEPTVGRTDFQEEVAALNGVNIPLAAYCFESGLAHYSPRPNVPARIWWDPLGSANTRRAGGLASVKEIAPGVRVCNAYFRLNDPMPYFVLRGQAAVNKIGRVCRSVVRSRSDAGALTTN